MSRWPGDAPGRTRHDGRVPLLQRRARAARAHGPQGLSGVVRPARARPVPHRCEASGAAEARAPFYSHVRYDIVPDAHVTVRRPDVVIVEGLNVLSPPPSPHEVAVSDLFDFSIYVDAEPADIAQWYVDRFSHCARERVQQPELVLQRVRGPVGCRSGRARARLLDAIELPNLRENVEPTKHRATLVLTRLPTTPSRRVRKL